MLRRRLSFYTAVSASLITFLVYLRSLWNQFLRWDDNNYIVNNPYIRELNPDFFGWAFLDFYASNWHPLTWFSHALDYALWGLNPLGHHLTNNIVHAVNTFLVVLLAVRLVEAANSTQYAVSSMQPAKETREDEVNNDLSGAYSLVPTAYSRFTLVAASITGLLFGLHPIHVESVAWVSERKDLLCGAFFLLSIMAYMSYRSHETYRSYSLAFGFFTLALLSKPMAVSLPVVLLIIDWYPLGRVHSVKTFRAAVVEKIPFIALILASSIITVLAQKAGGSVAMLKSAPLSVRLPVAAKSIVAYLWKMIAPLDLLPFYPYPKGPDLLSVGYLLPLLIVICISAVCILLLKRMKLAAAAWGYYLVTLAPVLGLVQVGSQSMADRYSYLPSLGPFLTAGLFAGWLAAKPARRAAAGLRAVLIACALVFIPLGYLTFKQIGTWKNDFTLWDHAVAAGPGGSALAWYNRGKLHEELGMLQQAIADCNNAIALDPSAPEAYNVRGSIFEKTGLLDKALSDYNKAIALEPSNYQAHFNRGIALKKAGRLDEALYEYNTTIELNPSYYDAYVNRGNIFSIARQAERAFMDYDKAISLDPARSVAYSNRAFLFLNAGIKEQAASDFRSACNLGDAKACNTLRQL